MPVDTQPFEIIGGQKLVEMLQTIIDSRRLCTMEIPQTRFSWMTILLSIQKDGSSDYLLVDPVERFESILSRFPNREVSFEFLENGILCKFSSRVIRCDAQAIWLELPNSLYRNQKRAHFRVEASSNEEIAFRAAGKEERAQIKDYSLGGVSFYVESHLVLNVDDKLTDLSLILPQGKTMHSYPIPLAIVKRIPTQSGDKKKVCALQFLKIERMIQEELGRHIFEEQRSMIRRLRKI
jgi:c-di-GMP-binding flagellar brake protein YcgR